MQLGSSGRKQLLLAACDAKPPGTGLWNRLLKPRSSEVEEQAELQPVERLSTGFDFMWGAESVQNDANGDASRLQFMSEFSF